jgi:DNA-binding NtrC family response regulator
MGEDLLSGKRILIVDDEPDVLEILEQLLTMCEVVKATSFEKARGLLESQYFDIAILDIMGVDGYQLLSIANKRNVLGVMLTAHALSADNVLKSYKEGAAAYLPKMEISKIVVFLNDVLEAQQQGKHLWSRWFDRLSSFFDRKFGENWKEQDKDFLKKYKNWS